MKMIEAAASDGTVTLPDFGAIAVPGLPAGPVTVGVRPEQLGVGRSGDVTADGTVTLVEYLGSESFVYVRLGSGQVLLVQTDGKARHKIGDPITLAIVAANAHYFGAGGERLPVFDSPA